MTKLGKWLIWIVILKPLILANYWLRKQKYIADEWFWADWIAFTWGYSVDPKDYW